MRKAIKTLLAMLLVFVMTFTYSVTASAEGEYPYYSLCDEIVLPDGGYNLNTDYIGIKTIYVNKALLNTTGDRYGYDTANAVKKFQNENGLEATGEVDLQTWLKLGYSEEEWYGLGTYTHPILTTKYSSREEIVNAMLIAAKENADEGTIYRVGSSGPAGTYTDCSGLIFQCLYAAGINPEKNIVDHALAIYEYTSRNLEADPMLGERISESEIEPGDLVFYQYKGVVCHVGILAGNGKMYDSWPNIGVTYRNYTSGGNILCFKRVLPDYDEFRPEVPGGGITGKNMPAASNSLIIHDIEGETVLASEGDFHVVVEADGVVSKVTLSKDVVVPNGGYVLSASGERADWTLENIKTGDILILEDDCVSLYVEEVVEPEPDTEEESLEATSVNAELSVAERIRAYNKEREGGMLVRFSLFP